jgi:hypothetical protein
MQQSATCVCCAGNGHVPVDSRDSVSLFAKVSFNGFRPCIECNETELLNFYSATLVERLLWYVQPITKADVRYLDRCLFCNQLPAYRCRPAITSEIVSDSEWYIECACGKRTLEVRTSTDGTDGQCQDKAAMLWNLAILMD